MGRIERQKRLIIEQSNKQILGESTIDKEEAKNLVMKRFGENPPTEEDFEDFENARVEDIDDSLDTKEYADLFDEWKNSISDTEEEGGDIDDNWCPDQSLN